MTTDERRQKYATGVLDSYTPDQRVEVVMALADAEQAELRAALERVRAVTAGLPDGSPWDAIALQIHDAIDGVS